MLVKAVVLPVPGFPLHCTDIPFLPAAAPPALLQMRNLVLSAFPRAMRLPDPFTPNLKVDLLPEIAAPPRFVPDPSELLPPPMRADVDAFLARRGNPSAFLMGLRSRLTLSPQDALVNGTKYNVALVNALVFYAGIRAVEASPPKPGHPPAMATPSMELFQHLLRDLDTGGWAGGRLGCAGLTCSRLAAGWLHVRIQAFSSGRCL